MKKINPSPKINVTSLDFPADDGKANFQPVKQSTTKSKHIE
jgi:hypothetical protein